MFVVGCWSCIVVACCALLEFLVCCVGCLLLVDCCSLFVVCCSVMVVGCLLLFVICRCVFLVA